MPWVSDARSPVYGTLGRANFLGAYLALLLPPLLALYLTSTQRTARVSWATVLVGVGATLVLTQARAAILAALVAVATFGWLWIRVRHLAASPWWWRVAGVGIALLALLGPIAVTMLSQTTGGSPAARTVIWRACWTLLRQRPWLGYGPDALPLVFPSVFPPELVYYQGRNVFVDRAHNVVLDWAINSGTIGVLAWGLVLATFIYTTVKALQSSTKRHQAMAPSDQVRSVYLVAALAAVAGGVTNTLVSFDVTATALATWLLMGMAVALAQPAQVRPPTVAKPRWMAGVILVVVGWSVYQSNLRPLLADIAARTSDRYTHMGVLDAAMAATERSVHWWPVSPAYAYDLSQHYIRQAQGHRDAAESWLRQAEAALIAARDRAPQDVRWWAALADFYATDGAALSHAHEAAHMAYRHALALAPQHATLYVAWGRLYMAEGNADQAAVLLRQAVALDASSLSAYLYLAETELALGRTEVALADYREAVRIDPASIAAQVGLARTYWLMGDLEAAQAALARAEALDPNNPVVSALRDAMS